MQRLLCYHLRQVHTSIDIDKTMKSDLLDESWLLYHPRAHWPSTLVHTASDDPVRTGYTEPRHQPQDCGFFNTCGIFAK